MTGYYFLSWAVIQKFRITAIRAEFEKKLSKKTRISSLMSRVKNLDERRKVYDCIAL